MKFDKTDKSNETITVTTNTVPIVDEPAPTQNKEETQHIPKHRFDEVNNLMKEYKSKLDELESQIEAQKKAELEKTQQYEELYKNTSSELETLKNSKISADTKLTEYENVVSKLIDAKLESIPEEYRKLVPESYTPTQKLDWLNLAETNGLFKKKGALGQSMNVDTNITQDPASMSAQQKMAQAYQNNGTSRIKGL